TQGDQAAQTLAWVFRRRHARLRHHRTEEEAGVSLVQHVAWTRREGGRKGTEADESRGWAGSEARRCSHSASSAPAPACEEKARRQGASKRKPPRAGRA